MRFGEVRLLVSDFPACFRFYRDIIGFKPTFGEEGEPFYASFDANGATLALFSREMMAAAIGKPAPQGSPDGVDRFVLNLMVENLDDAMREIGGRGGVFIAGPTDQPAWGGRVAHLRDPDGVLIELYQTLPAA